MSVRLDEIPDGVAASPLAKGAETPSTSMRLDDVSSMQGQRVDQKDFDLADLSFSAEEINALKAKGKIGYFEQSIRMKKLEKLPVLGLPVAAYETGATLQAFKRLQKDEYGGDATLKDRDIQTAQKAIRYAAEEQVRGFSWGGGFIEGAANLPAYGIEFMLSSVFAQPGSAAVVRGLGKGVVKEVTNKAIRKALVGTAAWGTRAAIRTGTVFAPEVAKKTFQNEAQLNLVPTDRGLQLNEQMQSAPFTSFTKALGDTMIEVFSEEAGSMVFNPVLSKMAGAPVFAAVGKKMTELYKKLHPSDAVGKLFTKAGWDGFVSEIGEEVLGDQMRAVFNVSDFGAKDGNTLDRVIAAIPDGDEMMVMMGVLAVPGASHVALSGGLAALDDYRAKKAAAGQEVKPFSEEKDFAKFAKQQGYDPVEIALREALAPLPQAELSNEEMAALEIKDRSSTGSVDVFSKPVPERKLVEEIKSTKEFKEADKETQMGMLIKGRTAELDVQRTAIEDRMSSLEKDILKLSASKDKKNSEKQILNKKAELVDLSKKLMSVHAQISDVVDSTAEEISREKVLLPGESLDTLREQARKVGARLERSKVETVFRNLAAQAEERRTALVKYLQARLPGPENAKLREQYNLRAAKDMTEEKLQKFFTEVEKLRETVRAKQLRERAEKILEKMQPILVSGVKRGVFDNSNIQSLANEVIRIANLSAPEAEKELYEAGQQLAKLDEMGEGESEAADDLRYRAGLLSKLSGLEQRNADQLEEALRVLIKQYNMFLTGRDTVRELRKAQRQVEERSVTAEIRRMDWQPKTGIQKLVKKAGQGIGRLYQFSTFHLEEFWRDLGGSEAKFIKKMILDPLAAISRHTAALQISMDRPVRQAVFDIYGISKEKSHAFMKFLADRMSLDPSDNPDTAPYLKDGVLLNNGTTKDFKWSRWDVMYAFASTHEKEGERDEEAYEIYTGENELEAIRELIGGDLLGAGGEVSEADIEAAVAARVAQIKGNAIPAEILEDMFNTLTEKDRKFALAMRQIFTSFWPIINPVYARATGIDLTQVESYIPRIRKTTSVKSVEDLFTQYAMIEGHITPFPGSVKERRSTSTAPFAQVGLIDVYMGFRNTMSHWIATHDISSRIQRYLKNRTIRDAINKATDGELDNTGEWRDGSFVGLMDFHLKGIVSRGRTDNTLRIPVMDLMRRNISRYMLSKPKQLLVQLSSSFAAIQKIGHLSFIKGQMSFWRDPKGSMGLMNKALSLHGRYQNIMVEMKEVQDLIKLQRNRFRDKLNWLDKYMFFFTQVGDRAAISMGGWAVFKDAYDKTKSLEHAYNQFDVFVNTLQQSALREHQSAATVGPARYFFQFISAVSQYGRAYYRSWSDLARNPSPENIKLWARTMVVFHLYIPTAMWAVSNIGVPPDEDEDEEENKALKKLLAFQISGPFSGLWILGVAVDLATEIITGQQTFDSTPAVLSEMNKVKTQLSTAIRTASDEDADPEEVLTAIFKAEKSTSGLTAGVPGWFNDSVRMLYLHSQGEWDSENTPGVLYGQSIDMLNYRRSPQ